MREKRVTISNRLGLHARAAARFVRRAGAFASSIELVREDNNHVADGKSILEVLMLAATTGTTIVIKADGADETEAAQALAELVDHKFEEEVGDGAF